MSLKLFTLVLKNGLKKLERRHKQVNMGGVHLRRFHYVDGIVFQVGITAELKIMTKTLNKKS